MSGFGKGHLRILGIHVTSETWDGLVSRGPSGCNRRGNSDVRLIEILMQRWQYLLDP